MQKLSIMALVLSAGLTGATAAGALSLTSPDLKADSQMSEEQAFSSFGCSGKNMSPALAWSGAPANTKSFALNVYDPDAPTGSGFWHWVVFNIPADVTSLPKGAGDPKSAMAPKGATQGHTDYGMAGYGGPCPPPGDKPHHYIFTIYALDVPKLDADENATAAVVGFNLHFHTLEKASLTATYKH